MLQSIGDCDEESGGAPTRMCDGGSWMSWKMSGLARRKMNPAGLFYWSIGVILATVVASTAMAADDESAQEKPPIGFFTKLTFAHGVQDVKDIFGTDRYK